MHDDKIGNDGESLKDMSEPDMLAGSMGLMSQEGISDSNLRKIIAYVERFFRSRIDWSGLAMCDLRWPL